MIRTYVYVVKTSLLVIGILLIFGGAIRAALKADNPKAIEICLGIMLVGLILIFVDIIVTNLIERKIALAIVNSPHGIFARPIAFTETLTATLKSEQVLFRLAHQWVKQNFFASVRWYADQMKTS